MSSHTNHSIKKRTKPRDVFITPRALALKHIRIHNFNNAEVVLDPCRHNENGSYYSQFDTIAKEQDKIIVKQWCELSEGSDFLESNTLKPDHIISNPPYSILDKWFKRCRELKPKEMSFLIGLNNLTTKRIEEFEKAGYGITHFEMLKVWDWFGMSLLVKFTKGENSIINYDRKVYHTDK